MKRNPYRILRRPIVTEKSVAAKERARTLCFQVDPRATKVEIKEAVEEVFRDLHGKIESVHTATFLGKAGAKLPEYSETA
jgi:large subunit ribosomal protein L23